MSVPQSCSLTQKHMHAHKHSLSCSRVLSTHSSSSTCSTALRPTLPVAHVHMSGWVACNHKHPPPSSAVAALIPARDGHARTHARTRENTAAWPICAAGQSSERQRRICLSARLYVLLVWKENRRLSSMMVVWLLYLAMVSSPKQDVFTVFFSFFLFPDSLRWNIVDNLAVKGKECEVNM